MSSISARRPAAGAKSRRDASARDGRVIAIDILEMKPVAGVEFLQLDFLDETAPDRLKAMLDGKADVVLSDMAANATGHRQTDHLRIMALAEAAAHFAREVLSPGGSFLCKVLQGRNRSGAARRAQARLRQREACQATGEPQRFGGALSARPRLSRRCISDDVAT